MKQMILTGLATEQKFGKPDQQFFLVFNDGELRVPITPQAAESVVEAMYSQNGSPSQADTGDDEDVLHTDHEPEGYNSETDIPQA